MALRRAYRSRKSGIPRAAHRDLHEPEIIRVFRAAGASVQPLSAKGVPDLLVGFLGRTRLVEVKTDNAALTEDQVPWHREWKGEKPEIVRNEAQARKLVRMWTQEFARNAAHRPDLEDDLAKSSEQLEAERESGRVA